MDGNGTPKGLAAKIAAVAGPNAEYYATRSKASSTWRVYGSAVEQFREFCAARGAVPLPADIEVVRLWLIALGEGGYTVSTLRTYLAGLVEQHKLHKHTLERQHLAATLKGLEREFGTPQRRAQPIRMAEMRGIVE